MGTRRRLAPREHPPALALSRPQGSRAWTTLPTAGSNGNYIFPNLRGPAYTNHDFAIFKNFPMGGSRKFQFRASFTNVFNHPQRFLDENTNLRLQFANGQPSNSAFGVLPQDNKYGRRIVQLAFKMYF